MAINFESRQHLERVLRRVAEAHRQYEQQTGRQDAAWAVWYSTFIDHEQNGQPAQG